MEGASDVGEGTPTSQSAPATPASPPWPAQGGWYVRATPAGAGVLLPTRSILWIKPNELRLTAARPCHVAPPGAAHLPALRGRARAAAAPPATREPRSLKPGPAHRPEIFTLCLCQLLATLQAPDDTARLCLTEDEKAPRKAWAWSSGR